jgi:hypothetical protein
MAPVARRGPAESLFGPWELNGALRDNRQVQTTVSRFSILKDTSAESNFNPVDPLDDGTGTVTAFDNSGWTTPDVKLRDADFAGTSTLGFIGGYHFSTQRIEVNQYASANPWPQRTFFAEVSVDVLNDLVR